MFKPGAELSSELGVSWASIPVLTTGTHLEFTRPQNYLGIETNVISQKTRKNYCSVWQPLINYNNLNDSKGPKYMPRRKIKYWQRQTEILC